MADDVNYIFPKIKFYSWKDQTSISNLDKTITIISLMLLKHKDQHKRKQNQIQAQPPQCQVLQLIKVQSANPSRMILDYSLMPIIPQLAYSTFYSKEQPSFGKKTGLMIVFSFMFLNLFVGNDIVSCVFVILFAAMDFWTVKNVTGRILVNLRWWSEIDEDGVENWVFESSDGEKNLGGTDSFVFWSALYLTPLIWGFFAFMDLLSLKFFWMYVCIMCLTLSSINLIGFYKCQKDFQNKVRSFIQEKTMSYFLGNTASQAASALGGIKDIVFSRIFSSGNK